MSKVSDKNLQGIPMKPYDLLREGLIMFAIITGIIIVLAVLFSSPDYPTVRGEEVAKKQPIAFLKTSANYLSGDNDLEGYGPPYTRDFDNSQRFLDMAPANWFGVTIPLNPAKDFILTPLGRVGVLNKDVADALQNYESATPVQQKVWLKAYLKALDKATVVNQQVQIPHGDYGPVAPMMDGMLALGRAGLLEGTLESDSRLPYNMDYTRSLLFFQGTVYGNVADSLDLLGEEWGISHETGSYPGAWWLWPYTFLYQIPALANSPNADLLVGVIMMVIFLVLLLLPVIPLLNRLPKWLGVYKLIWRDWYQRPKSAAIRNNSDTLPKSP